MQEKCQKFRLSSKELLRKESEKRYFKLTLYFDYVDLFPINNLADERHEIKRKLTRNNFEMNQTQTMFKHFFVAALFSMHFHSTIYIYSICYPFIVFCLFSHFDTLKHDIDFIS